MSTPTPTEVAKSIGDLLRLLPSGLRAKAYAVMASLSIVLGSVATFLLFAGDVAVHGVKLVDLAPIVLLVSGVLHLVAKANVQ